MELTPLSQRLNFRNQNFHSSIDEDVLYHEHQTYSVELRKKKRRVCSNIKRSIGPEFVKHVFESSSLKTLIRAYTDPENFVYSVLELLARESGPEIDLECLIVLDKIVKSSEIATVVLKSNCIDIITSFLSSDDQLVLEKVSSLFVNLACGDADAVLILSSPKIIDDLVRLFRWYTDEIERNALWALCNICFDSSSSQKYLNSLKVDKEIIDQLQLGTKTLDKYFELLTYLCRDNKTDEECSTYLKISDLVLNPNSQFAYSKDCQASACWILFYLADKNSKSIDLMLQNREFLPVLVYFSLYEEKFELVKAAVYTLSIVSSGNVVHTQRLLENGVLDVIDKMVRSPVKDFRKEGFFLLSNIVAGAAEQIKAAFVYKTLIVDCFVGVCDEFFKIRRNAWHAYLNICKFKCKDFVLDVIKKGFIAVVFRALSMESDEKCIELMLKFIENLISAAEIEGQNTVVEELQGYSIFEWVSGLQYHHSNDISDVASRIIDSRYGYSE